MSTTRKKAVDLIKSWIGLNEKDGSHRKIIDIYNSHKHLPRGYKMSYDDPWCAATVSAVAIALGATDIIPPECSCAQMIELAKIKGIWVESDGYIPSPGDIILYDWGDDGSGDCTGSPDHVGMVTEVNGKSIHVAEGNYSGAVKTRVIQVNGKYIRGYIVPQYAPEDTGSEWSKEGRTYAIENGLIMGVGKNHDGSVDYAWDKPMTREEMAVVLHRFAVLIGKA